MLSFIRFVLWDGDIMLLLDAKMKDEKTRKKKSEYDIEEKGYKAENIGGLSVKNELQML